MSLGVKDGWLLGEEDGRLVGADGTFDGVSLGMKDGRLLGDDDGMIQTGPAPGMQHVSDWSHSVASGTGKSQSPGQQVPPLAAQLG